MKIIGRILMSVALVAALSLSASAQVKIGYTNIELVLAYMPETKQMERTLTTYQKKLGEQLQVKEQYAQRRLQEVLEKKEKGTLSPNEEQAAQVELTKLDEDIRKFAAEAEERLLARREELLIPILEKLQKAIDEVSAENGFTYILNQTTSTGVSTILFGPEENDITELLFKKLGIPLPKFD